MSGVSLPAIRGALPSTYKASYTGLESRPDSRSSSGAGSNYTSFSSNNVSYGKLPFFCFIYLFYLNMFDVPNIFNSVKTECLHSFSMHLKQK